MYYGRNTLYICQLVIFLQQKSKEEEKKEVEPDKVDKDIQNDVEPLPKDVLDNFTETMITGNEGFTTIRLICFIPTPIFVGILWNLECRLVCCCEFESNVTPQPIDFQIWMWTWCTPILKKSFIVVQMVHLELWPFVKCQSLCKCQSTPLQEK